VRKLNFVRYNGHRHFAAVMHYMTDAQEQNQFITYTQTNSDRDFENWFDSLLSNYYQELFVIEKDDQFAGMVYSYENHLRDGHCKIGVYIAPSFRVGGMGARAGLQLMDYLFRQYPFRRINCDVYSYNKASLDSLLQCGFEKTGVLKEYRYLNGSYFDLELLTMSRSFFMNRYGKLFEEGEGYV